MSDYVETLAAHRRLTILRFLNDSPEYTSNASILTGVCNSLGVTSTRDQVQGDIGWLAEQGLARVRNTGDFAVVTATGRGVEVALGRARHDGVQRPQPGLGG